MLLQLILCLLLSFMGTCTQLANNPLVSALNALANLGECSVDRSRSTVLEVCRLLLSFGLQLIESRTLGNLL